MESPQKTNFTRHARIKALTFDFQLGLKRCMDKQETLGLEGLGLDKPAAPQNTSRATKGKRRRAEDKASLQSKLQQASGQHTSSINYWHPSAVPSYQSLPIAPLGGSADTWNHWPSQIYHHGLIHNSPAVPRCHPVQASLSLPGRPSVSRYQPEAFTPINGPSTVTEAMAVPFVQPKVPSRGLEPTVHKSTLSVLTYRGLPFSRVDKQYRYSKANPPISETIPVQRGRWTGSLPANLRKTVSRPSGSSQLTKTRDLEATRPATRDPPPSIANGEDDLIHLPAPTPTSAYLSDAHAIPSLLSSPRRLLLVLDLNGTLLYRPRASQNYTPRPCLTKFLKYAFTNHSILVWSSAQPYNVKGVCARLFSRDQRKMVLGEWGRDTLGLTSAESKARVQVYKRLDRIWLNKNLQNSHPDFEEGERWGQHNTVLIDDSALKASAQPFNHVKVPEFVRAGGEKEGDGKDVLGQVVGYLEEARKWSDVSGFVRHRPFEIGAEWRWEWEWHRKKPQGHDQCEDDNEDGGVRL